MALSSRTSDARSGSRQLVEAVELNDIANSAAYRHLNFGFKGVQAAERHWSYVFIKLQNISGKFFMELRRNDMQPSAFDPWPETYTKDEYGDFLRVAIGAEEFAEAERLRVFLRSLSWGDRIAMSLFFAEVPQLMREKLHTLEGETAYWADAVSALSSTLGRAVQGLAPKG